MSNTPVVVLGPAGARVEWMDQQKAAADRPTCGVLCGGRVSYLTEVAEEAVSVRREWEVERRVMAQQLRAAHDLCDLQRGREGGGSRRRKVVI